VKLKKKVKKNTVAVLRMKEKEWHVLRSLLGALSNGFILEALNEADDADWYRDTSKVVDKLLALRRN
jgi:hypothetical protein